MIKKKQKRGQFVVSIALLIAIIAMTAALSVYFASMLHHQFRYKGYKEIISTINSDFKRALTNALSKATHDYVGVKPGGEIDLESLTYNYTLLRLSAQNFMDYWKQTVINSYSSMGLEMNLEYRNKFLLEEKKENYSGIGITIPERWLYNLTTAYWFYPESISAIRANLSLNITGIGFYGFKTSELVYLILGIDINDLKKQAQSGEINHLNVVVLKEGGIPVHDLTTKNFMIRVFDLYTGSWRKVPIIGVSYYGDGYYTVYLPPQQKKGPTPPSPSPGKTVTVNTTVTATTTTTTSIPTATRTTTVATVTTTKTVVTTKTLSETTKTITTTTTTSMTSTRSTTTITQISYTTKTSTSTMTLTSLITTTTTYTTTQTSYETTYTATTESTTTLVVVSTTYTTTKTTTTTTTKTITKYTTTTITTVPKKPIEEPATTVTSTVTSYITTTTTVYYTTTLSKTATTTTTTTSTATAYSSTKTITSTITRTTYPTTTYLTTTTITVRRTTTTITTVPKTVTTTTTTTITNTTTSTITLSLISTSTITTTSFSETTVTTTKTITQTIYTTTSITITEYMLPLEYSIWFQVMVRDNRGIIVEAETYKDIDFMVERNTPSLIGSFRKQIIIKAGSETIPSGYSISFTFDHASLVSSSKSLPSGSDVRIFYFDGNKLKEIDRALDEESSWNSPSTKIWFKTQASIPAGGSDGNYYLYYGYINDSNPLSDKSKVYDFYTDFYNIDDWGKWRFSELSSFPKVNVSSGIVKIDSLDGKKAGIYHKTYTISGGSTGYLLKVKARHVNSINDNLHTIWVYFDVNETNGAIIKGYTYCTRDAQGNKPDHIIIREANQTEYSISEVKGDKPSLNNWYIYEFYVTKDNRFKGLRDGEQMVPSSGWVMDNNYIGGKIAIGVEGDAIAEWDWIIVRKYLESEPTITLGNEENVTGIKYPEYEVYNVEVMYSAVTGTKWMWHGHNLTIVPIERKPIPPLPIRFLRVNVTRSGYSDNETDLVETISQVEEWSKDLRKPLYVYQKNETSARFGNTSKLVFNIVFPWGVKNQKVRIWWKDYLETPPPTYGIKLSIKKDFVIIDNGIYKLQLLAKKGYSYLIDWSISINYSNYHAEFALYGYEIYQMPSGGLWYPMKIPAGDWDWPIVYGPVRAIAHRYTNIVHDYPNDKTITDELLHEMYIIVPYNVSYFLWIMNGTWLKSISTNYLTAIMMITGDSFDEGSPIRLNDWAYVESTGSIKESPPTFNDINRDLSLSIETKDYGYWSAQYREGFGVAIILSKDTLNLLNKPNHMLHIFTSADYSRRVIDYSPEDSYPSTYLTILNGAKHNIYAAIWVYDRGHIIPEIWSNMFIEDYYPRVWVLSEE
jgi:hypothetical protein